MRFIRCYVKREINPNGYPKPIYQGKIVMKRIITAITLVSLFALAGCKAQHPSKIIVDPEFDANSLGSVLIAPVVSSISEGVDPKRESERVMNRILLELIAKRTDHKFLSPEHFKLAVRKEGLDEDYEQFKHDWMTNHEADPAFLLRLRGDLDISAILISQVYLWNKDEADYREEGTASSTSVGATLTLIDFQSGKIVWEATDENYKESVRTEGNRVQVDEGGFVRRVSGVTSTGRDMYSAPPFEDVALLVLQVLVEAIPQRGAM
jgi:hypothetical protein